MWRKTICAASGLVLACVAAYGLHSIGAGSKTANSEVNFDLRWLYPAAKSDRLSVGNFSPSDDVVTAFNVPAENMTIAAKGPTVRRVKESAVQVPRRVRTVPIDPVRTVPNDDQQDVKQKEKLPEGCEPSFSPVTMPAFAHISARCDS